MLVSSLGVGAAVSLTGVMELSMFICTALSSFLNTLWFLSGPFKDVGHVIISSRWSVSTHTVNSKHRVVLSQPAAFLVSYLKLSRTRKFFVEETGPICFWWETFLLTCIRFCTLETSG